MRADSDVMKSGQNVNVEVTMPTHPTVKNMKLISYDTAPLSPRWLAISTFVLNGRIVMLVAIENRKLMKKRYQASWPNRYMSTADIVRRMGNSGSSLPAGSFAAARVITSI